MKTMQFRTNLNCGSCVAAVTPLLDGERAIEHWHVDTQAPEKILTMKGEGVSADRVRSLVAQAGFRVIEDMDTPAGPPEHRHSESGDPRSLKTFYPLALIPGVEGAGCDAQGLGDLSDRLASADLEDRQGPAIEACVTSVPKLSP